MELSHSPIATAHCGVWVTDGEHKQKLLPPNPTIVMKEEITYKTKCAVCGEMATYVLRGKNVNPMSDDDVVFVIERKKNSTPIFEYCEKCKLIAKQEIVAFDY